MSTNRAAVTGQWMTGSDGVRWFFDPGALCLDFGYTGDYGHGVPAWEHLHDPADLRAWLHDRFSTDLPSVTQSEFDAALALRSAITSMARVIADAHQPAVADIDLINRHAVRAGAPRLLEGGTTPVIVPSVEMMLASIAQDAVTVFSTPGHRVRQCGADDCALIFFDASRPGRRRWCSMQRCGNRAKTRAHYARHHDHEGE